ncbi:tail fiber domain-containing protein [Hymenobacter sp. 15J16-1T3B]|uniref:tail fiber domain-containing protein n=1 Tax=Hymenobacter sp. 15J16-1T3B TaxID=2886941 RepID=UPI001D10F5E9|nr:tail fiber domain-containing protein [Hymenobacter sp. 15J16-1T3B]MCC3160836.1 tail fiber domain-containing protein [Hymenobacter sp. 15J16-1T3B]
MPRFYSPSRLALLGLSLLPLAATAQNVDSLLVVHTTDAGHKVSRATVFQNGGFLLGGTYDGNYDPNAIPAEGGGLRLMWHPRRAAFRAGYVDDTQWDDANIGNYSIAAGYNTRASGDYATAFGFRTIAAQVGSTALGQYCQASGAASVAMGYYAHTNARQGSFVFADRSVVDDGDQFSDESFRADANHSASWRVSNGFRIYTASDRSTGVIIQSGTGLTGNVLYNPSWYNASAVICTYTGAYLSNGGAWTNASDRRKKHRFEAVAGEDVLRRLRRVPITRWSYKTETGAVRHLGPMAQDFYRAFQLGPDSISIGTVDADGVALAGVQALDARTQALQAENQQLRAVNAAIQARLTALEQRPAGPASAAALPWAAALAATGLGVVLLRARR